MANASRFADVVAVDITNILVTMRLCLTNEGLFLYLWYSFSLVKVGSHRLSPLYGPRLAELIWPSYCLC